MKNAKKLLALLLSLTLALSLALPAFAEEDELLSGVGTDVFDAAADGENSEPDGDVPQPQSQTVSNASAFTVTADKQMVATGESITLTAVNVPQAQAGQSLEYHWYVNCFYGDSHNLSIGTTVDAVIQTQAPSKDDMKAMKAYGDPFSQQFPTEYWCIVKVSDASGLVASYTSSRIEVSGYYSLRDSFVVPYEYIGYTFLLAFFVPPLFFENIGCLFGILWSPFVALANAAEAKRVNG